MIALDTSSTISGYAYFEDGKLKKADAIDCSKEKDAVIRQENMGIALIELLNQYTPDTVVIEMTVVPRNVNSQRLLSEIVGICWGWALEHSAEFVKYRPSEWRKLAKGDTNVPKTREDLKDWSVERVHAALGVDTFDDNISDACLIGYARIKQMQT